MHVPGVGVFEASNTPTPGFSVLSISRTG